MAAPIASVSDLLFYRVIVALAILLIYLNRNVLKTVTDVNKEEIKYLVARVIMFIMNIYAMQLVMKYLTLTEAAIINSFQPLVSNLMATLLLKERFTLFRFLLCLLSMAGVLLMILGRT